MCEMARCEFLHCGGMWSTDAVATLQPAWQAMLSYVFWINEVCINHTTWGNILGASNDYAVKFLPTFKAGQLVDVNLHCID